MRKIGITGPIGSGKTHVCKIFTEKYNIPVFNSDEAVREIQDSDPYVQGEILKWLGYEAFISSRTGNKLNRSYVAKILFNDIDALERMVALVRPLLMEKFYKFCYYYEFLSENKPPFILFESAILMQRNLYNIFDGVILVCADKEVRIKRVYETRGMERDNFEERNKEQPDCDEIKRILTKSYIPFSIIENENDEMLMSQIELANINYGKGKNK